MLNKILCIDDDPITLMLCKKVISKTVFSQAIDTALNGVDAIKYLDDFILKLQNNPNIVKELPELIFLDLNMPVMNGWEFLDTFSQNNYKEIFNNTKVVVLSSTIDPRDIEKSKTYSMVIDFLSKPITIEMLELIKNKT
jgi:CheY-like chemotaxis protein